MRPEERKAMAAERLQREARLTAETIEFFTFLDANAEVIATWPQWMREAFTLRKDAGP